MSDKSREDVAADAIKAEAHTRDFRYMAARTIAALDAWDDANGVHRIQLDEATVDRVALWLAVVKFPRTEWPDLTVRVADLLRDSARGLLTFIIKPRPNFPDVLRARQRRERAS